VPVEFEEMRTATQPRIRRTQTQTERINTLESHPTALERIETHRSLHLGTVGSHITSRTQTRESQKDLPAFGAGKPYPPSLPKREVWSDSWFGKVLGLQEIGICCGVRRSS